MTGDQLVQVLSNDGVTVKAAGDKVILSPRARVEANHKDLVRANKEDLLRVLRQWPDQTVPAWAFGRQHVNQIEQGVVRPRR